MTFRMNRLKEGGGQFFSIAEELFLCKKKKRKKLRCFNVTASLGNQMKNV